MCDRQAGESAARCGQLHQICSEAARFDFHTGFQDLPKNGVYLLFEKGEKGHGTDRIVRVGTHTGQDGLKRRVQQHFTVPNKNRSIFRKNIGRCMLARAGDPYLKVWDYAIRSKDAEMRYASEIDKTKERQLEEAITEHIRENFTVSVIRCNCLEERLLLESRIISTVSNCTGCGPGKDWFGCLSTREKIRKSGLWQVNELYKENLSAPELERVERQIL